jgi:flavin reductase (DIM6/NTAB) family NADH-FMN oxidoreductase RutF
MDKELDFNPVRPETLAENFFRIIGHDGMLITAGTMENHNPMTASWGGIGFLWDKPVAYTFIRPTRHTFGFMEKNSYFTLSFFKEDQREILQFCGVHSGRDMDKESRLGLHPVEDSTGAVYYSEARLVLVCKKLYHQDLHRKQFHESWIHEKYADKNYHRMYISSIEKTLVKE